MSAGHKSLAALHVHSQPLNSYQPTLNPITNMPKKTSKVTMTTPVIGALRVWHIPQVPGKPFHVPVATPQEAKKILDVLAQYDLFQFQNRIKPDYCNAAGLEVHEADDGDGNAGWCEWYDEETGDDIDSFVSDVPQAV